MKSITEIVPHELIPVLTKLGKHNWLRFAPVEDSPRTSIDLDIPDEPAFDDFWSMMGRTEGCRKFELYVLSKALAQGPKILIPTTEQCEALQHTDIRIGFADYRQPFPVVIIELPARYKRNLLNQFGVPCPTYVIVFHQESTGYIITMAIGGSHDYFNLMPPRPEYETIEVALKQNISGDTGPDMDLSEVIQRLALNFSLMMTHAGVRVKGPARPQAFKKQQRLAKSRDRRKAEKAKHFLATMPFVLEFEQKVSFFEDRTRSATKILDSDSTGRHKKPHWRRGHWRNQRYGAGRTFTKLVFIRPMLVNRNFMLGDESRTRTTYISQHKRENDN